MCICIMFRDQQYLQGKKSESSYTLKASNQLFQVVQNEIIFSTIDLWTRTKSSFSELNKIIAWEAVRHFPPSTVDVFNRKSDSLWFFNSSSPLNFCLNITAMPAPMRQSSLMQWARAWSSGQENRFPVT